MNQRLKSQKSKVNIDIEKVAKLANLKLSKEQKKNFDKQLKEILAYFSKLEELKTSNVEPIGQITGLENVTREDETAPSLTQDQALKNAPRTYNGFIEVDAIFEERS